MLRHIPFYSELLDEGATTNEILLYGLIDVLSFTEGFCYASSEFMAKQLGVAKGTIRNLLSSLSKLGWISVEVQGNKRIAITPLLGLSVKKKDIHKSIKPVEKSKESVTQELQYCHSTMTLPSRKNDTQNRGVTGKGITSNNKIDIEGLDSAMEEPNQTSNKAMGLMVDKTLDSAEYERQFYERNTICI